MKDRSVYLHQTFSINYRLKHKKTMILHFEIKQTDNKPYISNQRALLRCDAGVGRDKSHLIITPNMLTRNQKNYIYFKAKVEFRLRWYTFIYTLTSP